VDVGFKNNKKGFSTRTNWILGVVIFLIILIIYVQNSNCVITQRDINNSYSFPINMYYGTKVWIQQNVFFCDVEEENKVGKIGAFFIGVSDKLHLKEALGITGDVFGFNQGILDFIGDLIIGAMAGVWLFLIYLLARSEIAVIRNVPLIKFLYASGQKSLKTSWISMLAGSYWKIIPIAVFYAVVMQIPILNRAVQLFTLEWLLHFEGTIWGSIILSFIIAFYLGIIPMAFEAYHRYSLRMRYERALMEVKYEKAKQRIEMQGGS